MTSSAFTKVAVTTGLSMLGTVAELVLAAMTEEGMTRDEARLELVSAVAALVEADRDLEQEQAKRQADLDAAVPPE